MSNGIANDCSNSGSDVGCDADDLGAVGGDEDAGFNPNVTVLEIPTDFEGAPEKVWLIRFY